MAFMPTFKYKVGTNTYLGEAAAKGLPPGSSSAAAAAAALSKMSTALTEEDGEEDEEANGTAGEQRGGVGWGASFVRGRVREGGTGRQSGRPV